ncbi:MAG: site-specific integrase [Litorilituus sp.]|nr:site-specific integrase [Litorilituus sp.]
MYIFRNRNGTYYTRINLPKVLRQSGFPFSICSSLGTKCRQVAIDKNLMLAAFIRQVISNIPEEITATSFSAWINHQITQFKSSIKNASTSCVAATVDELPSTTQAIDQNAISINAIKVTFSAFIESKQAEAISERSIAQLKLRVGHFIEWLKKKRLGHFTRKEAMDYRNELIREGRSYKTTNDYLSAIRQFFKFCVLTDYCSDNYFTGIKQGKKPIKRPDEERKRWSREQLTAIFTWLRDKRIARAKKDRPEDTWVPLLSLFAGLRTAEACQLQVKNIKRMDGIDYIQVDSVDEETDLKNSNAYRDVPIHSALIKDGFLDYVAKRKLAKQRFLFDCRPSDKYSDWSAALINRFYWHLNLAGITGKGRPTIYSFRHTFIDELQQHDVPEHIVAEIVGHSKTGITFGRYGKRVNLSLLKEKIELISADLVNI